MEQQTRRDFVRKAGKASAAASVFGVRRPVLGANEKVAVALIGGRNQGRHDAMGIIRGGGEIKTFCDIDDAILQKTSAQIAEAQGRAPAFARDLRRVLDDKDIDAVIVGLPDHWHARAAIQACQAGKDVYVEKPLTQTIHEGHLVRDAARKYGRVMQVGTQRRSGEHFKTAVEYVASGKLGKICLIRAWICQVRDSIGTPADRLVPAGVDYDMWLGPAPSRPFNPNRFHYNWRFFWDYGNTELGNQGVHMLDIAMWGIQALRGMDRCLPTHVSGTSGIYWLHDAKEVPDTQVVTYDYGDMVLVWELQSFQKGHAIDGADAGTAFYGTEGTLVVDGEGWRVTGKNGEAGPKVTGSDQRLVDAHTKNFLECVKSRQRPNGDVELGRLSTTLCHLGNICCRLGRDIRFDPKSETFPDDARANAMLTREYRPPYLLPSV
jgi:predicted dehydrogenase